MKKVFLILTLSIISFTCTSFTPHKWQHENHDTLTDNILRQFTPDQNAYRLFHSIPEGLRHLSYGIYPISKGYDTARFNYNKRFNVFPNMIITPRTKKEAAFTLRMLKKHHLPFSIRSGGHCIQATSLSSSYIFDLRHFNKILPNVERQEVYIGAGALLGTVIEKLGAIDYAIPTGTCSSVGTGGLSLGGGLGVLGRVYGLTCDSIKSITFLTASGRVIEVNKKNHPDLFWALRGAGNGSYGIVLGFTFKMHYVPHVSYLTLKWKWNQHTVHKVFQAWQAWIKTLPHTITTQLKLIYLNHKLSLQVTSLKVGKKDFTEWKKAFAHLHPKVQLNKERYIDSAKKWADRSPFPFLKSKSEMIMKPLSYKPVQVAVNFFEKLKKNKENYFAFFELEALGGKIAKGHTAYYPRKAEAWWYHAMYWDQPNQEQAALDKLRKLHSDLAPYVSKHSYANIVDYDIGDNYLETYYGNHVNRLIRIKNKYDPENLFHWRQSIPLKR